MTLKHTPQKNDAWAQDVCNALSKHVRGRLILNVPLAPMTRLRVGGNAKLFFSPADQEDLQVFLNLYAPTDPLHVLGLGSNVIFRDNGFPGCVLKLSRDFVSIKKKGDLLEVGAATLDASVARFSISQGLAGLSFYAGIPGTIGGAIKMNAGCLGKDTSQVVESFSYMTREGKKATVHPDKSFWSYRNSALAQDAIVTNLNLKSEAQQSPEKLKEELLHILDHRKKSQPISERTAGSTFKNPHGQSAWRLIKQVHGQNLRVGGIRMSPMHANFMVNTGGGTAHDCEVLGEEIIKRVFEETGTQLEWEVKRVGEK